MRSALLTTVVLGLLAIPASASSMCADLNGGFETDIRATNVSCTKARAVVKRWHHKAVNEGKGPVTMYVNSYWCKSRSAGDPEHVLVACADHKKKITFYAGP
jgi:hypothetical protein